MTGKFIIYQLLLRVFANNNVNCINSGSFVQNGSGKFDSIDDDVIKSIKKLSVSYIWFTGILRHATKGDEGVKGEAGSPYAIKDYYDVNPCLSTSTSNRMSEFDSMVQRVHNQEVGVIIDFVPNHLSRSYFSETDNFTDLNFYPGKIYDGDWSDTVKLNYSNRDTWIKMRDILLFWADKKIDGFRCDMVELVPFDFWRWCIGEVKAKYPDIIFIGEAYQRDNYGRFIEYCNFDYLYDKSGFYDTLRDILTNKRGAFTLTSQWQQNGSSQDRLLNFLENHDEQRIASKFFLGNPFYALPALYVSLFFNKSPFMLYFGQEFGENGMESEGYSGVDGRTSIYDYCSLSNISRWLRGVKGGNEQKYLTQQEIRLLEIYRDLFSKATDIDAFKFGSTFDLEYANPHSDMFDPNTHFAFLRFYNNSLYVCVVNFSFEDKSIGVNIPTHAFDYFGIDNGDCRRSKSMINLMVKGCSGEIFEIN